MISAGCTPLNHRKLKWRIDEDNWRLLRSYLPCFDSQRPAIVVSYLRGRKGSLKFKV